MLHTAVHLHMRQAPSLKWESCATHVNTRFVQRGKLLRHRAGTGSSRNKQSSPEPSLPRCMTKKKQKKPAHTFLLVSPPLASLALFFPPLSLSVSCFLASSGSSKQESSPNDGIKRVRKMTEKEKEKECGRQLFAPQHPQILSSGKKKEKRKRQQETVFL